MTVTRRYKFAASHRLHSPRFSESENQELYGKCNNPHGHGHDYILEISVAGPLDVASGQVVNVANLDRLVTERVIEDFNSRYLNMDVPEFQSVIPTSENILGVIEDRLRAGWRQAFSGDTPRLESIRLRETRRNLFELKAS